MIKNILISLQVTYLCIFKISLENKKSKTCLDKLFLKIIFYFDFIKKNYRLNLYHINQI